MPYQLDDIDIAIINSLLDDGRKSLRRISRDIKISVPTVKIRFQRLVDIGLIKSFVPLIDANKLSNDSPTLKMHQKSINENPSLASGMNVKITCDLCDEQISNKPHILKIAKIIRYFCCKTCKSSYKEKYKGRIESILKKSK